MAKEGNTFSKQSLDYFICTWLPALPHTSTFDGKAVHTGDYHILDQEWHH